MERYIIWSNLELKLDDWRERVLADSPALAGDEAGMERRMAELNNLRLLDARINFDEELDGPILALGEVQVGEESAPVYKLYPSGNPASIFYTDSPRAEYAVDPDGDLIVCGAAEIPECDLRLCPPPLHTGDLSPGRPAGNLDMRFSDAAGEIPGVPTGNISVSAFCDIIGGISEADDAPSEIPVISGGSPVLGTGLQDIHELIVFNGAVN